MYSLVALDTQHIKHYVFPTDKLKEIRGASSLLDQLNRRVMDEVAGEAAFQATNVFANGGSALFWLAAEEEVARRFGERVQRRYREVTGGGASLAFATLQLPAEVADIWHEDLRASLDVLYKRLEAASYALPEQMVLPAHPFLRPCDACGSAPAETRDHSERSDPAVSQNRYCAVCARKRREDNEVKQGIEALSIPSNAAEKEPGERGHLSFAWQRLIDGLLKQGYQLPAGTDRPDDFHELGSSAGGKEYLALLYADGNGMGQVMEQQRTLSDLRERATLIDDAVYAALSAAVVAHLPVSGDPPRFPFDLLLVGGDDILMVTPATEALDVALTLARTFREQTRQHDPAKKGHSLSVGMVLAPVSYPFGLLLDLAESTLKYAKKEGAKKVGQAKMAGLASGLTARDEESDEETFLNFMTVTGSTSQDFRDIYASLCEKHGRVPGQQKEVGFYATLRPYSMADLQSLLDLIREGKGLALGRTKLHQIREAVLKMNLTSSVTEGLSVLRNWRSTQRDFILRPFYQKSAQYQEPYHDVERPETLFPRVTFPWFADGPTTYRSSLLDFVELYDFVEPKGAGHAYED